MKEVQNMLLKFKYSLSIRSISVLRYCLTSVEYPIVEMTWSYNSVIFTMRFAIPLRHIYIETGLFDFFVTHSIIHYDKSRVIMILM